MAPTGPTGRLRSFRADGADRKRGKVHEVNPDRSCLVIDPQPTVRLGVCRLLAERYSVDEADHWRTGLEILEATGGFDVAIVDMNRLDGEAAGRPGTAAIRAIRRAMPGIGIVAHGIRPERHAAAEALDAGATAFVAKLSPATELERAVDAAADAETFVDPAAKRGPKAAPLLTRRQRQILQLYADGYGTAAVANQLGLSAETVRTHTKGLLARLGARDRAHAVAIGLRNSLID
jgi:DNA-binding NarL/FixJ family response regulator